MTATSSLPRRFFVSLAIPALASAARAGEPRPPRAVPADGVIRIADFGFRDWGPEVVRWAVDPAAFPPGRLALAGPGGRAVSFQVRDGVLEFVAAVGKGQTAEYRLRRSEDDRSREGGAVEVRAAGDAVEIANGSFALRVPAAGKRTFDPPVAAGEVPPPVLGWRPAGGEWMGGARFSTDRKVAAAEFRAADEGPATVAWEARYRFAPRGEYVWSARVSLGVPVAIVEEDHDLGEVTGGRDFLMLGLGEGCRPAEIGFLEGEGPATASRREPAPAYLERKAKETAGPVRNVGAFVPPAPFVPGPGLTLLEKIVAGCPWGLRGGIELRGPREGDAAAWSVSLCPYHVGSWRRATALIAWHDPARGIEIALPIGVRPTRWYLDLTDDASPFSSHEHDPDLPPSYGRRVWALGFDLEKAAPRLWPEPAGGAGGPRIADPIARARAVLGTVGLDRYKEWIVDWPRDEARDVHPCGQATPALAARLRAALDRHPEKDLLRKLWIIDGRDETGAANAEAAIRGFRTARGGADWHIVGLSEYGQTYQYLWTVYADSALAWPGLPAERRAEIRRYLALHAYLLSEPDYNPRGAGVHLGNPNMPIGRTEALATMAPLIPDHPLHRYWMDRLREITAFRLSTNTEPGGAWFEPPTYQMYGPARALTVAQIAIRNAGAGDLAAEGWHRAALLYDANLTVPEARTKGWRVLPGMGNSGLTLEGIFGISSGAFDAADPDFAGFLRWFHRLASGNERLSLGGDPDYSLGYLPDVPERPRVLRTAFIPGYGVVFRAHFGSPDETALLFRCGYAKSHWDMDDLNVILCGKGAPLSPGTGYQYYSGPATEKEGIHHNRVKVGRLDAREPHGRVDDVVTDYGFGDEVDHAAGRQGYPPEYFGDGKGGMEWRRHILFLKSRRPDGPSYFVIRDTFPGGAGRPVWWHWLNLETADRIAVDGRPFDRSRTPFDEVAPEDRMPALAGRTLEMATRYGAGTAIGFAAPAAPEVRAVMTFDYPIAPNYHHRRYGKELGVISQEDRESKTIVRIAGRGEEGFEYVVFPHRDGRRPPAWTRLGDGAVKVETGESTDYCFLGDAPFRFEEEDVVFTGKAGAVRVYPDRVALSLAAGSGRVGWRGFVLEGPGPFERTVPLVGLTPGVARVEGGYEKRTVSADLGGGVTIEGEAPFDARLDGRTIRIRAAGRARVLLVTRPDWMARPELRVDGRRWMAGWTDEAGSDWGRWTGSRLIAVTVPDGEHELVLTDMVFPRVWDRQFEPRTGR